MNIQLLFYGYAFWVVIFWLVGLYEAIHKRNVKSNLPQVFFGGLFWFFAAIDKMMDSIESK